MIHCSNSFHFAELSHRKQPEPWLWPSLALPQGNQEGTILMVVLAHPLGRFGYILYLSSRQPLIGKPVPASHLTLTSSQLCEGVSLPSVGLAVILVFSVFKAQQPHISHHQTRLIRSIYQRLVSLRGKVVAPPAVYSLRVLKLFQQIVQISIITL